MKKSDAILKRAHAILRIEDISVGEFVHHRTWTVPAIGPQQPVVKKRPMRVMKIVDGAVVCGGGRTFDAFELVKSGWTPNGGPA